MKVKTEFGDFEIIYNGDYADLFLSNSANSFHIGWLRYVDTSDSITTKEKALDRFIQLYIQILRFETKLAIFGQIPTGNKFKDAVLRMQIEEAGQTFDIRKYIGDSKKTFAWFDYPLRADVFDIETLRDSELFVLRCPYGLYLMRSDDHKSYHILKRTEDNEKILSDLYIPYNDETNESLELAAVLQGIDTISNDINDIIRQKRNEMLKRLAETIKYMYGYDKLRVALRNRALA